MKILSIASVGVLSFCLVSSVVAQTSGSGLGNIGSGIGNSGSGSSGSGSSSSGSSGNSSGSSSGNAGTQFDSQLGTITREDYDGSFIGRGDGSFVGRGGTSTTSSRSGLSGRTTQSSTRRTSSRTSSRTTGSRSSMMGTSGMGNNQNTVRAATAVNAESQLELAGKSALIPVELQSRVSRISQLQKHPVPVSVELQPDAAGWTANLKGVVATPQQRRLLEQLARLEPGVQSVRNEIVVHTELAQPQGLQMPKPGTPDNPSALGELAP